MKKASYLEDIHDTWRKVGKYKTPSEYELELAIYKKMLDVFQTGAYYYIIFSPPTASTEFISDGMQSLLGYTKEEFTIDRIMSLVHPDDLPFFLDFERTVVDFKLNLPIEKLMKYKSRYDYRIKKKSGEYIRILQQSITIQTDAEGAVIRNLVVHTDITDLKKDNTMKLSFIGIDGEQSFINVEPKQKYILPRTSSLTKREREVLLLITQNKTTAEIAEKLFLSTHTVSTHRKNILAKTECSSVVELVAKALSEGLV